MPCALRGFRQARMRLTRYGIPIAKSAMAAMIDTTYRRVSVGEGVAYRSAHPDTGARRGRDDGWMKQTIRGVLRVTDGSWAVHVPPLHLVVPVSGVDTAVSEALPAVAAAAKRSTRTVELDVHLPDETAEIVTRERLDALLEELRNLDEVADDLARIEVEIRSRLEAQRERVDEALLAFGAAHTEAGTVPDAGLMHRIYWQAPLVRAETLARVLHLKAGSQVHAAVGPRTEARACRKCGTEMVAESTSRAESATFDRRFCEACRERLWQEAHDRWANRSAAQLALEEHEQELFDAAIRDGTEPSAIYVEYPGLGGTWRVDNARVVPADADQ